jgi:hypothetical protein
LESTGSSKTLQSIQDEYFGARVNIDLINLSSFTFIIKCPLFIQLNLSKYGFDILPINNQEIEAYIPDVSMIKAETLEDKENVAQYIKATTEALILNHKGLPMDGVDEFTAQLLTPINTYNSIIIKGCLKKWIKFLQQKKMPREIQMYQDTITQVIKADVKNIHILLKTM